MRVPVDQHPAEIEDDPSAWNWDTVVEYALALNQGDKLELEKKLFELQTSVNTKHESLREILLSSRRDSGNSNFTRRQVLILIELIDILELAIGNLPHVYKMQQSFKKEAVDLNPFVQLIFTMADELGNLSQVVGRKGVVRDNPTIDSLLQQAKESLRAFRRTAYTPDSYEEAMLLQNIYDYLQKQAQKIQVIRKVMQNLVEQDQLWSRTKASAQFITPQDYDWKTFTENFNFDSPIFKHSLRLTLTVLVGFAIGVIFPFQNAYWILLTITVIMRPGYTLTRERSKHRLYGTLIGGAVAVAVVVTVGAAIALKVPVLLALLAFGAMVRNFDREHHFVVVDFGRAGHLFYVILFVVTGAMLDVGLLASVGGAALAFVVVRSIGKALHWRPWLACRCATLHCWWWRWPPCRALRSSWCMRRPAFIRS